MVVEPDGALIYREPALPPPCAGGYCFDVPMVDEKGQVYRFQRQQWYDEDGASTGEVV
jgi:hypothetical protein